MVDCRGDDALRKQASVLVFSQSRERLARGMVRQENPKGSSHRHKKRPKEV